MSSQTDSMLLRHIEDSGSLRIRVLDQNVNLAVTQLTNQFGVDLANGLRFVGHWTANLDEQIDVTAFELIIDPRPEQRDPRTFTQHGFGSAFDGVDLGWGQAHGGCAWPGCFVGLVLEMEACLKPFHLGNKWLYKNRATGRASAVALEQPGSFVQKTREAALGRLRIHD